MQSFTKMTDAENDTDEIQTDSSKKNAPEKELDDDRDSGPEPEPEQPILKWLTILFAASGFLREKMRTNSLTTLPLVYHQKTSHNHDIIRFV